MRRFTEKLLNISKRISQIIVGLAIIASAVVLSVILYLSKQEPKKIEETPLPSLVETITVDQKNTPVTITAYGTVRPSRELTVQSEVSGRVIEQSPDLDEGGILKEGQIILKIDPRNYLTIVEQEKAAVAKAEYELKLERGKKVIAEKEWQLLDPSQKTSDIGRELALRIPNILEKEAALQAAKSKLEKALLDLNRTVLRAPFNAVVTEELVEVGQLLSPQTNVATLVSTDEFRVQVSIPFEDLFWISFPKEDKDVGTEVKVIQDLGGGRIIIRQGNVIRLLGTLDPQGRMARVLVGIKDPLSLKKENQDKPPLLIDTYVQVQIQGSILKDVFVIPRKALREDNRVWVMNKDHELEIRDVTIANRTKDTIVISKGLHDQDKVIISQLPVAIPGMKLRSLEEEK